MLPVAPTPSLNSSPSSAAAKQVALLLQLFFFELCISRCSFIFLFLFFWGSNKAELSTCSVHTAAQHTLQLLEEHVCLYWNKRTLVSLRGFCSCALFKRLIPSRRVGSSFFHCPAYEYTNQKPLVSIWFAEHSPSISAPYI